jgi:Raf kinase inhibitor-like YbhB/YbcL family protein
MRGRFSTLTISVMALLLLGCTNQPPHAPSKPFADKSKESKTEFKLTSTAFQEGQAIPRQYTCDGVDVSPPLEWSGAPSGVKSFALICDDPDAPSGTFVHWVLYNLPGEKIGFVENVPKTESVPGGGLQGWNDFKQIGYGGPCPPSGTHRYFFKLYAVDTELSLKAGATKADVEQAMSGHIVGQAQLMGIYRR